MPGRASRIAGLPPGRARVAVDPPVRSFGGPTRVPLCRRHRASSSGTCLCTPGLHDSPASARTASVLVEGAARDAEPACGLALVSSASSRFSEWRPAPVLRGVPSRKGRFSRGSAAAGVAAGSVWAGRPPSHSDLAKDTPRSTAFMRSRTFPARRGGEAVHCRGRSLDGFLFFSANRPGNAGQEWYSRGARSGGRPG